MSQKLKVVTSCVVLAVACSAEGTDPSNSIDPPTPVYQPVGEYSLVAVQDSSLFGEDGYSARTVGEYTDSVLGGTYLLFVGTDGDLSLRADSTYSLSYAEEKHISIGGLHFIDRGTVDLWGHWQVLGLLRDTLSFVDDVYGLEILHGVLDGESRRHASQITPLYIDLYLDQQHVLGDGVFKLRFRNWR